MIPDDQVYYFEVRGFVKIGFSCNPRQRVTQYHYNDNALPGDVTQRDLYSGTILATEPGGYLREAQIHHAFDEYRIVNEWFSKGPRLAEHIALLHDAPTKAHARFVNTEPLLDRVVEANRLAANNRQPRPDRRAAVEARNRAVLEARLGGYRGTDIARVLGVGCQRVEQIFADAKREAGIETKQYHPARALDVHRSRIYQMLGKKP